MLSLSHYPRYPPHRYLASIHKVPCIDPRTANALCASVYEVHTLCVVVCSEITHNIPLNALSELLPSRLPFVREWQISASGCSSNENGMIGRARIPRKSGPSRGSTEWEGRGIGGAALRSSRDHCLLRSLTFWGLLHSRLCRTGWLQPKDWSLLCRARVYISRYTAIQGPQNAVVPWDVTCRQSNDVSKLRDVGGSHVGRGALQD